MTASSEPPRPFLRIRESVPGDQREHVQEVLGQRDAPRRSE
jgi:hypothetical protein